MFGLTGDDAHIAGGTVLSGILFLAFLLPTAFATRGKHVEILIIAAILPLTISVAFSWLDSWVFLVIVLLTVALLAKVVSGVVK